MTFVLNLTENQTAVGSGTAGMASSISDLFMNQIAGSVFIASCLCLIIFFYVAMRLGVGMETFTVLGFALLLVLAGTEWAGIGTKFVVGIIIASIVFVLMSKIYAGT